ncbi:MAG: hypothetical protein NVS9B2_20850 [Steroidobacteraceae bacterium]
MLLFVWPMHHDDEGLHRGLTRSHALAVVVGGVLGTGVCIRLALMAAGLPVLLYMRHRRIAGP